MKTVITILMILCLILFQSGIFSDALKGFAAILGIVCLVALICFFIYEKKKKAIDPLLMLNDIDFH